MQVSQKQQANHDDDSQNTNETKTAAADAAVIVAGGRALSTNGRISNDKSNRRKRLWEANEIK